jgi:hypothetical protein
MDDKDMIEKVIIIDENTKIIKMREELVKEDLKIDFVVIIQQSSLINSKQKDLNT